MNLTNLEKKNVLTNILFQIEQVEEAYEVFTKLFNVAAPETNEEKIRNYEVFLSNTKHSIITNATYTILELYHIEPTEKAIDEIETILMDRGEEVNNFHYQLLSVSNQ